MKRVRFPEQELQRAIVEFLRVALGSRFLVWHPPNEGERSRGATGAMVGAGMLPGVADIVVSAANFCGFLEVKVAGGRLSPNQETFRDLCRSKDIPWGLATSLPGAEMVMRMWGLEVRGHVV